MRRHCDGEQHICVPVAPGMHVSPALVHARHTPPEHDRPEQQSPLLMHDCPRGRHWHRPPEQLIEPQQSADVAQLALAIAHAQRPPMQAAPLQHSADEPQGWLARLQQVPDVPPVAPELQAIEMPPAPGQHRVPVGPDEHAMPGLAHIEPVPPSPMPPGI